MFYVLHLLLVLHVDVTICCFLQLLLCLLQHILLCVFIFVNASCAYDYMLFLITNLCVFSFDCQLTSISITCDLMVWI